MQEKSKYCHDYIEGKKMKIEELEEMLQTAWKCYNLSTQFMVSTLCHGSISAA